MHARICSYIPGASGKFRVLIRAGILIYDCGAAVRSAPMEYSFGRGICCLCRRSEDMYTAGGNSIVY